MNSSLARLAAATGLPAPHALADGPPAPVTRLGPLRLEADMARPDDAPPAWPTPLMIAPACRLIQRALGQLEETLAPARQAELPPEPVFVTGLPCGGALDAYRLIAGGGHYAHDRDGDGAFVAAPRAARLAARLRRAEGGPAALDEARWAAFGDGVGARDRHRAALARLCTAQGGKRYLGKNAALMRRLPEVRACFPDARIVVAFREPLAQIAAMPDDPGASRTDWLTFWVAAHARAAAMPGVVLLDTDRLRAAPRPIARRLAQATGTPETDAFLKSASDPALAGPAPARPARFTVPSPLLAEARALHWRLARQAI